jgi:hypothetical protein
MVSRSMMGLVLLVGIVPHTLAQAPNASGLKTTAAPITVDGVKTYIVPEGTKIPLVLKNEISTRDARPGDPVFLVSDFPVVENGEVVLPAGLSVKGVIDSVQRGGKVKGRAQLQLHFESLILPNNVVVPLPGSLDRVPGSSGAQVKNSEGTIEQGGSKGKDGKRIVDNSLEGAGIGGVVGYGTGSVVRGVGIGAGAGAAVGVITTLFTRGNDVVIPQGASVMMVFSRPLMLQEAQLSGMPASSGIILPAPATAHQSPVLPPKPSN